MKYYSTAGTIVKGSVGVRICALFFALLGFSSLHAQITFNPLSGPSGGYVSDIEANSDGDMFALSGTKLYKSEDLGGSWTALNTGAISGLIDIYIDNTDKIYLLNKDGVANSTDDGATWTQKNSTGTFQFIRNLQKDDTNGWLYCISYISGQYGLARSSNEGSTWTASYSADQVNDYVVANKATSNYLYIATNSNKIMRNISAGAPASWTAMPGTIAQSAGHSVTYNKFSGYIYTIMNGATYYSSNDGVGWTAIGAQPPSPFTYSDGDGDWEVFASTTTNNWFILYVDDKNSVFSTNRLYVSSTTNGAGWTELTNLGSNGRVNTIYSFGTTIFAATYNEGILKSNNTGSNWSVGDNGIYELSTAGFLVPSTTTNVLQVAYGTDRLKYSFDNSGNKTFDAWSRQLTSGNMSTFAQLSDGNILAIGSNTWQSIDNGSSYTSKGTSPGSIVLSSAHRFSDAVIWAIGSPTQFSPVINNIYRTADQGTTWTIPTITGLPVNREITEISTTTNGDLYIGLVDNGSSYKVYKLPNAGTAATQVTIPTFTSYYQVRAVGTKIYVLGSTAAGTRLAVSGDAAANWAIKTSPAYANLSAPRVGVMFAMGGNNVIFMTNDEGNNWSQVVDMGNQGTFIGAQLNSNDQAILGIRRGNFYMSNGGVIPPNQPTNLTSVGTGARVVYLKWDYTAPPNVNSFYIERKLASEGSFTEIENNGGNKFFSDDNGVLPATDYVYRIRAQNAAGTAYSPELAVTTNSECPSTIPENRSWTGTIAATSFSNPNVLIKKDMFGRYEISDVTGNGSLVASSQPAIVAGIMLQNCTEPILDEKNNIGPNGNGTWNGTNTIVLNWTYNIYNTPQVSRTLTLVLNATDPTPGIPTAVRAYAASNSTAVVSWTPADYNQQFFIERSTNSGFTAGTVTNVGTVDYPTTTIADAGPLTPGTTYHYRVKAENINDAASAYSASLAMPFVRPNFVLSQTTVSNTPSGSISVVWTDLDNDGFDDLVMPRAGIFATALEEPLVFRNNGVGDFTLSTGVFPAGTFITASAGDYDNDGKQDMFLQGFGSLVDPALPKEHKLMHNTGSMVFTSAAPPLLATSLGISFGSSWVDSNNDGKLDLYQGYNTGAKLYLGDGLGGFTEKTGDPLVTDPYQANGVLWCDYDNDGDQDAFIVEADNPGANRLYENNAGSFTRVTGSVFDADVSQRFFGGAWGDYDNDGDMDLYVTVQPNGSPEGNLLYRNNGNKTFTKQATAANTPTESKLLRSSGSAWLDFDNDGDLDLAVLSTLDEPGDAATSLLYLNNGSGGFTKAGAEYLTAGPDMWLSFGLAAADYDHDGFLDLAIGELLFAENLSLQLAQPNVKLLKNNNTTGNWLKLKLIGTTSNASAIGAQITLVANSKTQYRQVFNSAGVAAQGSSVVHFGLGASASITSLIIKWPSGLTQIVPVSGVNQTLTITEDGTGPVLTARLPDNAAVNVSVNTKIGFDVNEAATPVATKKLNVFRTSDLVTPVAALDVAAAVHTGNHFEFTLPAKLLTSTNYTVTMDAGALRDVYSNNSLAVSGWTFTTTAGPQLASLSPADEATAVAANTQLSIEFDRVVTPAATKKISLYLSSALATPVFQANVTSGTSSLGGKRYSFTITPKLEAQTNYTVLVDAEAFEDDGSVSQAIASSGWNFTTNSGPSVTTLLPAAGSTNIASAAALEITFDRSPVTPVAGKKLKVFNGAAVVLDADVSLLGGVTSGKYTLPAPAEGWPTATQLRVTLDAGAFTDAGANDAAGISGTTWTFTIASGPQVATLVPAAGSTDIASTTALEITFDRSVTPVAGKKLKVFNGTTVELDADVSALGSVAGSKYTLPAPTAGWPFATQLRITLDPGAFTDAGANGAAGISGTAWTFTTTTADTSPPVFGNLSNLPATLDKSALTTPLAINVPVTDDKGVTSTKIFYRPVTGMAFTELAGTAGTGSAWQFTVPAAAVDAIGVQYYFIAADAAGNTTRSPLGTAYHQAFVKYSATDSKIPPGSIGTGGRVESWKVISIPFDLGGNNKVTDVFDELSSLKVKVQYGLLTFKDATSWSVYPDGFSTIERGKGYFINIKDQNQANIAVGDNLVAPNNTRSNLFALNLKKGWNQVGNPYLTAISWNDVSTLNSLTGTAAILKQYANGSYTNNQSVPAFGGGFVFVDNDVNNVLVPFLGQTAAGRNPGEVIFGPGDWLLPIAIGTGVIENRFGGIGMHKAASRSYDPLDDINAPRFGEYAELNFAHHEHLARNFARDVVPTAGSYTWEFTVDANVERVLTLSWSNLDLNIGDHALVLFDIDEGLVINMKQTGRHSFAPRPGRKFQVLFGSEDYVREKTTPRSLLFHSISPNPADADCKVAFSVPPTENSLVQVKVLNSLGQPIATVFEGDLQAGYHEVTWGGRDYTGVKPAAGVYLVTVDNAGVRETKRLLIK